MERRFLFHWIIMVVVKRLRGVTTRVRFLPVILTSLGSKSGTPFYPNSSKRVNTILKLLRRIRSSSTVHASKSEQNAPLLRYSATALLRPHQFASDPATTDTCPVTDHQKFSVWRNLGPGQRRGTRPWRWPRPGCWRGSWRAVAALLQWG